MAWKKQKRQMIMQLWIIVLLIASQLDITEPANILAFFPANGRSHFKPFESFFMNLARRGHNVSVVNVFPSNEILPNYREIILEKKALGKVNFAETRKQYRIENWMYMFNTLYDYNAFLGNQTKFRGLLASNDTKFDLIFMEMYHLDSFFLLAHRFDCPIIGVSVQPLLPHYHWMINNPSVFSCVPHLYLPYTDRMNFVQRFLNSGFHLFTWLFYYHIMLPAYDQQSKNILRSALGNEDSTYEYDNKRLSLIFAETHFSAGHIRPNLPNVVEVGGIHIKEAKPLPKDLQEFMDISEGVIYVSLGTLINPEDANEFGKKLLRAFHKLPYHIIWKWKTNLISNFNNKILIRDWLPQLDILRHPKCILFISHGGYHSLLETIYAGVPILGIPFFTDQHHNTALIEKFGIGEKSSPEANEEDLMNNIEQLINDKKYRKNVQYQSKVFNDKPMNPMDTAIYWTEYILRYNGTPHLISKTPDLYFFQYLGLDVLFTWIILFSIFTYVMNIFLKKCFVGLKSSHLKKQKN